MGLLLTSRGGAQDSFTVREEKDITSGLPGGLATSEEDIKVLLLLALASYISVKLKIT